MSEYAQQQDMGTFEDEDDFTEEDPDPDWTSPYEVQDMHEDPQLGPGYTLEPSDKESPTVSPAAADAPGTGSPNEPTPASAGKPEQD